MKRVQGVQDSRGQVKCQRSWVIKSFNLWGVESLGGDENAT